MTLEYGINLWPHQWQDVSRIEELGYESAWTSEHIFFYFPTYDALTSLAAMAARTSRIRLGTAVLLLPLRPAALAAKEIASVDNISGGRVILGAGIGGEYPKEFEAVGVPPRERGARADEALRVLKLLYTHDNVQFEGRFTRLDGVTLMPKPVQPGGPPIWVAGRSEAAMRRAGRIVDRYVVMGNADDCAARLADFAEAGVEHFILVPIVPAPADFMAHVEAYAAEVLPKMRA